nr:ABC transporter substrate-binding protein [uncultured Lichenicoccus sp.]
MRLAVLLFLLLAVAPLAARATDRVSMILDRFVNADHEQILAAEYCGAFARHGLQVTLIAPADTSSPPRLVAAGRRISRSATRPNSPSWRREGCRWCASAR